MQNIVIGYRFSLPDGSREVFDLTLDARSLRLKTPCPENPPEWTRLEFHQCPHCPLHPRRYPHCPVALNLVPMVERFDRLFSYDRVDVEVVSPERRVRKHTTSQEGLSSLMGLVIAGSDCPYTDFFKPMARFHLPFANPAESIWRATSTYLLAQHFIDAEESCRDSKLEGLSRIYENIARLNLAIVKRLRGVSRQDSPVNALIRLDLVAKYLTPSLEESLAQIREILAPFLQTLRPGPEPKNRSKAD